jgi:integrase
MPSVARLKSKSRWPIIFHGMRHSFVAIMVAAGCNVREVSKWAGHNSVAFTLTRYGGLLEDGADAAVDRLGALLEGKVAEASSAIVPDSAQYVLTKRE